jgi:hypothetical protein
VLEHIADYGSFGQIQRIAGFAGEILQHSEKEDAHTHGNSCQPSVASCQFNPKTICVHASLLVVA